MNRVLFLVFVIYLLTPRYMIGQTNSPQFEPVRQDAANIKPTEIPEQLFGDWNVVAVAVNGGLIPVSNWEISLTEDTYCNYNRTNEQQPVMELYNTNWKSAGDFYWTELRTNPPRSFINAPDNGRLFAGYFYIKFTNNSAVATFSETPLSTNFFGEPDDPISTRTMVIAKIDGRKTSRLELAKRFVSFLSPYASSEYPFSGAARPEQSQLYGGWYEEASQLSDKTK